MRIIVIMLCAAGIFVGTVSAQAAGLMRGEAVIERDTIHLGDLFYGVGEQRASVVTQAPEPGASRAFDAEALARIAETYELGWEPRGFGDTVTVTRAATEIQTGAIRDAVAEAISEETGADEVTVSFTGRQEPEVTLPASVDPTLTVTSLSYRQRSGRFTVRLDIPAEGPVAEQLALRGRAQATRAIPVPASRIERGQVIEESDIVQQRVDQGSLRNGIITEADQLAGQAARRRLRGGRPVRANDVQAPRLVERGEQVTLTLVTATMQLTARGRALESGAEGEQVEVTNTMSNESVYGTVRGDGRVSVNAEANLDFPAGS